MGTHDLVFMKQLLDHIEYVNEKAVLKVVKLFKHPNSDVTEGVGFAMGAFDMLQRLLDLRPELFTAAVIRELQVLAENGSERVRSAAQIVLDNMGSSAIRRN